VDYSVTELQLALLRVLWSLEEATVAEVQEALRPERELAATTVATLLTRLAKRGLVRHRVEGRQYVYRAAITEEAVQRSMAREVAELFAGDVASLVSHLLSGQDVDAADLERVKRLIEAKEAELRRKQ
jgi:BlaI family transcriptional regulator, penicillinase repressor